MEKTPSAAPVQADILIAADVTYAPEQAAWLRECDKSLLSDEGVSWLMVSVRPNGKISGISDSVEVAFGDEKICSRPDGEKLSISSVRMKSATNYSTSFGHDAESSLQISWRIVRVIFPTLDLSAILFLFACE